jgi:ribonuclease P protein component
MFRFNKSCRLRTKADYARVFEKAKKIVTDEFVVLYRSNTMNHARLGLAISKKMIAKAHDRNRVKRILREAFRQASLPSIDIIFMARSGLETKNHFTIHTTLGHIWNKVNN